MKTVCGKVRQGYETTTPKIQKQTDKQKKI